MDQELKETLSAAADELRSSMDAADYKQFALGLNSPNFPCRGFSGMSVHSVESIRARAGAIGNDGTASGQKRTEISSYGQESNCTTWRLAKMHLAVRGIDGQIAKGNTVRDRHLNLKGDLIASLLPNGSARSRNGLFFKLARL